MLKCQDCGWDGKEEDCVHIPMGEERFMLCPNCSSDRLIKIEEEGALLELIPA